MREATALLERDISTQRLCSNGHVWVSPPSDIYSLLDPSGCPYCLGRELVPGFNDLDTTFPDVAEWLSDPSLSSSLPFGSLEKVEWVCPFGHEWENAVLMQVYESWCPYCPEGPVVAGDNDLETTHPEAISHLLYPAQATNISIDTKKKVAWICDRGHVEWAFPRHRIELARGKCLTCDTLSVTHPDLAAQIVDQSLATKLTSRSTRRIEWKCNEGHIWKATVKTVLNNRDCPICSGRRPGPTTSLSATHPVLVTELVDPGVADTVFSTSTKLVEWWCPEGHSWVGSVIDRVSGRECAKCNTHISLPEQELRKVMERLCSEGLVFGDRTTLEGSKELDVLSPDHSFAIEFNGLYWHSTKIKDETTYHADKTKQAQSKGINLMHVWEDDWEEDRDLVIRLIARRLGVTHLLPEVLSGIDTKAALVTPASELKPVEVDGQEAKRFLGDNSLVPLELGSRHFGLIDKDDTLRAAISVGPGSEDGRWKVTELVTVGEVPGGLGTLLGFAERMLKESRERVEGWTITTPNDYTDDRVYKEAGFEQVRYLDPTPWYYLGSVTPRRVRSLEGLGDRADDPNVLTVYDSGSTVWESLDSPQTGPIRPLAGIGYSQDR